MTWTKGRVLWVVVLMVSLANTVRVLRDPEALGFFATTFVVVTAVAAAGTVSALILVAARRITNR